MSFRSIITKDVMLRMVGVMTVVGATFFTFSLTNESFIRAQSPQITAPSNLLLPDESIGIDGIARTLISVFDQADVVALGEAHQRKLDSERIILAEPSR